MSVPGFTIYPVTEVGNLRFKCSQPALHTHPFHQILLLTKGGGTHHLDGEDQEIRAPMALVVPRGQLHLYLPSVDSEGWCVGFSDEDLPPGSPLLSGKPFLAACIPITRPRVAEWLCGLAKMLHESARFRQAPLTAVHFHLLAAFFHLLSEESAHLKPRERPLSLADSLLVQRFMRLLDDACRSRWEAGRFAKQLRCSQRKLAETCQQALGKSIHAALEDRRMAEARQMLVQEDGCVKQVAMDLGYEDASYFSKAFRRVVGQTPTDYRNARVGQGAMPWGAAFGEGKNT